MRRALGDGFELDDDPGRIDAGAVHDFISRCSYWGKGRSRETTEHAIAGSARVVGCYRGSELVGFARAISDGATFAYLADVYILPSYRGRGLGLAMISEIVDGGPRWDVRWTLNTADAQALYEKLGFSDRAPRWPVMERARRDPGPASG
jgi:ribosomal protein S18 acetylase RimI-like enzyme